MLWTEAHRRYNPLRDSWVLCSPHRTQRPWQGQQESVSLEKRPEYDPKCYLCPGNTRANGDSNPKYESTFFFPNDFAAVRPAKAIGLSSQEISEINKIDDHDELFQAQQAVGQCYVICFNPRHDLTLAVMTYEQVYKVVDAWIEVYNLAKQNPEVNYCQIFENKGAAMGCSNPHPHGQAWTMNIIPEEPAMEHKALVEYAKTHNGRGLLEDYLAKELAIYEKNKSAENGEYRVLLLNDSFVALVPFWAVWPYEVMVLSRRRVGNVAQLTEKERKEFAQIMRDVALRYDNLFKTSFPYSMGLHQSYTESNPTESEDVEHLRAYFYPPLLRSATVKKFLVGFEMLGMPQRDITPEGAAATLRSLEGKIHYSQS